MKYGDIIGPQLAPTAVLQSGNVAVDTQYTVPTALAMDVLSLGASVSVSFTSPSGKKLLENANCDQAYTFEMDEIGNYKLIFSMEDLNGTIAEEIYTLKAIDQIPPQMTLSGEYKNTYSVGDSVKLLSMTATDNIDAPNEIKFYTVIVNPDHMYLKGKSGEKFTFDVAGIYKIRHCAYDNAGNFAVVEFEITVY